MSTVLEKAVLLDETGQLIVDKLDDIKEAIGNSGEYIPLAIRVTTPPTKVSYYGGDALDLSGIVVSLVGSNGSLIDVTSACTFSPANGATLSTSDTSVAITYHYATDNIDFTTNQPLSINNFLSIEVTTPPTVLEYMPGDTLDLSGIVVTASFSDGSESDVTNICSFNPSNGSVLTMENQEVNISCTIAGTTKTTTQAILVDYPKYGVEWDGSATSVLTRTDLSSDFTDPIPQMSNGSGGWTQASSPFDTVSPWKDIELIYNSNYGYLVKIPKFYFKWTSDGAKLKLQISQYQFSGSHVSPAHADRGDGEGERDFVYLAAYLANGTNTKSEPGYKSLASGDNGRAAGRTSSTEIFQWDYAMLWTVRMLYLVEFADWDVQKTIGQGCGSQDDNMGATASMTYHTGTTGATRAERSHVRYRYIEDLWANRSVWVDGIYVQNGDIYIIKNPRDFYTSGVSGGVKIGTYAGTSGQGIKSWTIPSVDTFEYALYPSDSTGGTAVSGEYISDAYYYYSSGTNLAMSGGGDSNWPGPGQGLFKSDSRSSDSQGSTAGFRKMYLPNNT